MVPFFGAKSANFQVMEICRPAAGFYQQQLNISGVSSFVLFKYWQKGDIGGICSKNGRDVYLYA